MKIICDPKHQKQLQEALAPYQALPLILVQKELEYNKPAIYFDIHALPCLIELLEKMVPNTSDFLGEKNGRWYPINVEDILFVEGLSRDTYAYTKEDSYRIKERITVLEKTWVNHAFVRISKSMIVNTRKIQYIIPSLASKLILHLSNDMEIEVSRAYANEFKNRMKVKL